MSTQHTATRTPRTGTICTPWDGVRVRVPTPRRASFSHLPSPRSASAGEPQRLVTPWSERELVPVPVRPVSFSSLAAPVPPAPVPTQRPRVGDELFSESR